MISKYYVYAHTCPVTKETVYVGKGVNGRAWDVTRSRGQHKKHQEWMQKLCEVGYIPSDWVCILYRGLSEYDAFKMELSEIHKRYPLRFNRQTGQAQHQSKLTNEDAKELFRLSWSGEFTRKELSDMFGICESNVSMIKHKRQWKSVLRDETNESYERSKDPA